MEAFQTRTALMAHQQTAVAKLLPSRVGGLFMDMGTGKSRALIELARLRHAKVDHVVWFTPVSLKETVRQEILKHTDCPPEDINVFGSKTRADNLPKARWHVVGIESMASSSRVVLAVNALVTSDSFVAVDESSYIKGHRALRTQRITAIASRARYRAILTGTPFSQGVVDLFSQMSFLSPKILGYQSFWSFANNHLEYDVRENRYDGTVKQTNRIIASHNTGYIAAKIAPYVYQVKKSECLDLPGKIYAERYCFMTPEQQGWHDTAKREFLAEMQAADDFSPVWLFKLFTALQTIACGFWNRTLPGRKVELIEMKHGRLDLLSSTVAEIPDGEKVIVWCKYLRPLGEIAARLERDYGPGEVARFDGTLNEGQRAAELARWRRPGCRFLVATQSSGGHGLTLNEAAHSVFYADGFKYSERIQAEDRNHRIGQGVSPTYLTLECIGSIDGRIQKALATKADALSLFVREVEAVKATGVKEGLLSLIRSL